MGIDIRLPNINASTEEGQLMQIKSYLYQFAEQLKYAISTLEAVWLREHGRLQLCRRL